MPLVLDVLAYIFGNFCSKRTASTSFWGFSSTRSSNLGLFFRLEPNFWWPTHLDVLALRINIEELDELNFFSCLRCSFGRSYISRSYLSANKFMKGFFSTVDGNLQTSFRSNACDGEGRSSPDHNKQRRYSSFYDSGSAVLRTVTTR